MSQSPFNPQDQNSDVFFKVIAGLERVSEAFKVLLWEQAKQHGLSPIQIQVMIFLAHHSSDLGTVSHLAREFNLTKATISDAVKVLDKKALVRKERSTTDSRSFEIYLTESGKDIVQQVGNYTAPIEQALKQIPSWQVHSLYSNLSQLIHLLNISGIIQVQRTCFTCRYYETQGRSHFCKFIQKPLADEEIRLDCPDHSLKTS